MNSINSTRISKFEEALNQALPIDTLHIEDESHLHAGHAGAEGGAGHFRIHIQSPAFKGLNRVQQHRLVYDALSAWIPYEIHALAIITN
ncbi:BolA family transcriptional regulator [Polynucleobacter sp. 30F-ANTBAC]|jgi:BolA family transcriptional regulator, general stress-responsive regulator|uniref:BolA family protein n=1 Tax=Polynucleobacter sp. 30F-ANTBAC TaxID=2689095 RepID=UPI001C0E3D50|nr:BolA family protein [Polynucleobacter sp. 30F-ANTBAC]MBU3599096.1 BolA family transcriptional regulator [Polynucleobacter sp. 30F-ANTBAC]